MFREMKRNWVRMGLTGLSLAAILAVGIVYGAGLRVGKECDDGYYLYLTGPDEPVKIGETVTFTATLTCEGTKPDPASLPALSVIGGTGTSVFDEENNKITWTGTADVPGLEGLVATATGGGGERHWDVVVVEVASAGEPQIIPIESDGETITLAAISNPPDFEDMISWTGAGCLDNNDGTCKVPADTAGIETYTATCGESSKTVDVTVVKVEILSPLTPQIIYQASSGNSVVINAQVVPSGMTLNWSTNKPDFIGFTDNQTSGTLWFLPGQGFFIDTTTGTVVLEVKEPTSGASAQCNIDYQAISRQGSVSKNELPLSIHASKNSPSANGSLYLEYESENDKLNANYDWIINASSPGYAAVSIVLITQTGFPGPPVAKAAAGFYSKLGNGSEIHRECGVTSGSSSTMVLSLGPLSVTVPLVSGGSLSDQVEHTNTACLQGEGSSMHSPNSQIFKSMAVSVSTDHKTENCDNIYWAASVSTNVYAYYSQSIESKIIWGSPY